MVEQEEQQLSRRALAAAAAAAAPQERGGRWGRQRRPQGLPTYLISRPAVSATAVAPRTARDLSMLADAVVPLSKLIQLPCSRCKADGGLWRA